MLLCLINLPVCIKKKKVGEDRTWAEEPEKVLGQMVLEVPQAQILVGSMM